MRQAALGQHVLHLPDHACKGCALQPRVRDADELQSKASLQSFQYQRSMSKGLSPKTLSHPLKSAEIRRFSVQAWRNFGSFERLMVMSWSSPHARKPILRPGA